MAYEKGKPWMEATIEHCEAPHHLAIITKGSYGSHLSLRLIETSGTTTLEFIHHRINRMLVAARDGEPLPQFDTYDPAQKEYFTALS